MRRSTVRRPVRGLHERHLRESSSTTTSSARMPTRRQPLPVPVQHPATLPSTRPLNQVQHTALRLVLPLSASCRTPLRPMPSPPYSMATRRRLQWSAMLLRRLSPLFCRRRRLPSMSLSPPPSTSECRPGSRQNRCRRSGGLDVDGLGVLLRRPGYADPR